MAALASREREAELGAKASPARSDSGLAFAVESKLQVQGPQVTAHSRQKADPDSEEWSARVWLSTFWRYLQERYSPFRHGCLIAAFAFSGMSLSAALRGQPALPDPLTFVACSVTVWCLFLMLRIADEHKDLRGDRRWRPYLPVPSRLIQLKDLRGVFIVCFFVQVVVNALVNPGLLLVLCGVWTYLVMMSHEFFARNWLRMRPVVYLLSHMAIVPLVDAYITACDWMGNGSPPLPLLLFLALSFVNGIVLEIGRKVRHAASEERGVDTYSKLWGLSGAVWLLRGGMLAALTLSLSISAFIGSVIPCAVVLVSTLSVILLKSARALALDDHNLGKAIETGSGLWVLVCYLVLGLSPLWSTR